MNDDFSQHVLERIEQKHVHPLPRWVVLVRRSLTIGLIVLTVVCAGILGSLVVLAITNIDSAFIRASSLGPMLRLILSYVPLVWVFLFAVLCLVEVMVLRHETHAYRYSGLIVGGFVLLVACLLGLGLHAIHLPERVESTFQRRLPPGMRPWMMRGQPHPRPEDGVLFGRIMNVSTTSFALEGPERDLWEIQPQRPEMLTLPFLKPNQFVLIKGRIERPGLFNARTIQPHRGPPPPRP